MEKITILCGMKDYIDAYKFMSDVGESLPRCGVKVLSASTDKFVLNTKYAQIGFIYDKVAQPLIGVKADAIFGREPYKQKLAVYLKELRPYDVGMGLVDYICEVEKNGLTAEAKTKHEEAVELFEETVRKHLDKQIYITTGRHEGNTAFMKEWERYIKEHNVESLYPNSLVMGDFKWTPSGSGIAFGRIPEKPQSALPEIKDVIFRYPATIVFWADGTKTVVKADGDDVYDREKGLAMAICKKIMGNKRDYYHTFLHWLKKA